MSERTDTRPDTPFGSPWPRLSYGCWRFAGTAVADAQAKIEAALDAGMTLIDTADIYGYDGADRSTFGSSESLLGEVLAAAPGLRERMILATKGGIKPGVPYHCEPSYLRRACEDSLRRLRVDVIDLYQIHRPDFMTHPAAVAAALAGLVHDGLVRSIGVSNYSVSQTRALMVHLDRHGVALVSHQPEVSLAARGSLHDGVLDLCAEVGLAVLAWSPLGGGALVSATADHPEYGEVVGVLDRLAEVHGVSRSAVALAWVMAHGSTPIPVIGTQRVERIIDAATASTVQLAPEEWYELKVAARHGPMP